MGVKKKHTKKTQKANFHRKDLKGKNEMFRKGNFVVDDESAEIFETHCCRRNGLLAVDTDWKWRRPVFQLWMRIKNFSTQENIPNVSPTFFLYFSPKVSTAAMISVLCVIAIQCNLNILYHSIPTTREKYAFEFSTAYQTQKAHHTIGPLASTVNL